MTNVGQKILDRATGVVNLVVPSPQLRESIEYPRGTWVIDPEASHYHIDRVSKLDPEAISLVAGMDPDMAEMLAGVANADDVRKLNRGLRGLIGRVDQHLKLTSLGIGPIVHRQPEDGLHPRWCAPLGDLFVVLGRRAK